VISLKEILKFISQVPLLRVIGKLTYKRIFLRSGRGRFYGVFNTVEEAKSFMADSKPTSYADVDLTETNIESFMSMHLFDYPVMAHLMMGLSEIKHLIDFGGHIGVKYYVYQRYIPSLKEVNWKVIDVPFCVERGLREASRRNVKNLSFCTDLSEATNCDALLVSGSIQYVGKPLGDLLDSMKNLPQTIIFNKLPLHGGPDFYTIENFGKAKVIYHIFNKDNFEAQLRSRHYSKADEWVIESRDIFIPFFNNQLIKFSMEGQVWKRKNVLS
jgi:putative methyltransferase (TIGR04325 family)